MAECRRLHPQRLSRPTEIAEFDDLAESVEVIEVAVFLHFYPAPLGSADC